MQRLPNTKGAHIVALAEKFQDSNICATFYSRTNIALIVNRTAWCVGYYNAYVNMWRPRSEELLLYIILISAIVCRVICHHCRSEIVSLP